MGSSNRKFPCPHCKGKGITRKGNKCGNCDGGWRIFKNFHAYEEMVRTARKPPDPNSNRTKRKAK